jgi:hypothetical protein
MLTTRRCLRSYRWVFFIAEAPKNPWGGIPAARLRKDRCLHQIDGNSRFLPLANLEPALPFAPFEDFRRLIISVPVFLAEGDQVRANKEFCLECRPRTQLYRDYPAVTDGPLQGCLLNV